MQFLCNAVGWLGFGWFPSRKIAIASDRRLASSATSYYLLASYSILLTVLAYQLRLFRSLPIHTKYIVKLPLAPFNHVHIDVCCGPCCEGMERIDIYSGKNHHLHVYLRITTCYLFGPLLCFAVFSSVSLVIVFMLQGVNISQMLCQHSP